MGNAVRDKFVHPMLFRLSNLGKGTEASDLVSIMCNCGFGTLVSPIDGGNITHMIRPSVLLRWLHDRYPEKFRMHIGADDERVSEFWNGYMASPTGAARVRTHPLLGRLQIRDIHKMVPLTVHEDAGPYSKKLGCLSFTFSSLLSTGPEKVTQCPIASCIKEKDG